MTDEELVVRVAGKVILFLINSIISLAVIVSTGYVVWWFFGSWLWIGLGAVAAIFVCLLVLMLLAAAVEQLYEEISQRLNAEFLTKNGITRAEYNARKQCASAEKAAAKKAYLDAAIDKIRTSPTRVKWWNLEKGLYWKIAMNSGLILSCVILALFFAAFVEPFVLFPEFQKLSDTPMLSLAVYFLALFSFCISVTFIGILSGIPIWLIRRQSTIPSVASRQS